MGKSGSLFFVKGAGKTQVLRNDVRYNGHLSLVVDESPIGDTRHHYLQDKEY